MIVKIYTYLEAFEVPLGSYTLENSIAHRYSWNIFGYKYRIRL